MAEGIYMIFVELTATPRSIDYVDTLRLQYVLESMQERMPPVWPGARGGLLKQGR